MTACTSTSGLTVTPATSAPADGAVPDYGRDRFGGGWADLDGDCQDTRREILLRDFVDVALTGDGCDIASGTLHDSYTGAPIAFRRGQGTSDDVQIDHIIPLSYAWQAGAWQWTDAEREAFNNDDHNPACRRRSHQQPQRRPSALTRTATQPSRALRLRGHLARHDQRLCARHRPGRRHTRRGDPARLLTRDRASSA